MVLIIIALIDNGHVIYLNLTANFPAPKLFQAPWLSIKNLPPSTFLFSMYCLKQSINTMDF